MSRASTFSNQIRSVIQKSGISRYALSKRTGVTQAALCRFMQGQCALTTETLDRLAPELGLTIDARYAQTPAGAAGKRVNYANVAAHGRKQKVAK